MKKYVAKFGLAIVTMVLLSSSPSFATTNIDAPEVSPVFRFILYNTGESAKSINDEGAIIREASNFTLDQSFHKSLRQAGEYWSSILKRNPILVDPVEITVLTTTNTDAANAISSDINVGGILKKTLLNAQYNGLTVTPEELAKGVNLIHIGNNFPFSVNELSVMPKSNLADLNVVIAHEMGHALGLLAQTKTREIAPNTYEFTFNDLSIYSKNLRVENSDGAKAATKDMVIEVNDASRTGVFNIANDAPYFVGTETMKVLDPDSTGASFVHYQGVYEDASGNLQRVRGLPINGKEENEGILCPELSHIELRNSYMSHQDYRNWSIFMEAELAVLKDLGYDIDLREHYGQSYYINYRTALSGRGFGVPNGSGGYLANSYNTSPFGVGLHIYGDNNRISQAGAILSSGKVSTGVRIDGVENTLKVQNKIDMQGENSIGILASYGKNHTITIDSGVEVSATGNGGVGAEFNFGRNVLGVAMAHRGSYMNTLNNTNVEAPSDVSGPLVKTFNVNGTLKGERAAIYIDDTAFVKEININNGATIQGDIISNWNSQGSENAFIQENHVQISDVDLESGLLLTKLNFNNYNTNAINDNIKGNTLVMNVNGSGLEFNGKAQVYNLNNASSCTLSGTGKYKIEKTFTNEGTYNAGSGSEVIASSIVNTGNINIDGNFTLGANIGTDGVTWGNLTIGATSPATVNLTKDVDKLYNNVTIDNNSTLNLINNRTTDIEVSQMIFNSDANMTIDVDLISQAADRLKFDSTSNLTMNDNILHIDQVNLVGNADRAIITEPDFDIPLISSDLHNENLNINFTASLPKETFTTAIFKYNIGYDRLNNRFMMTSPFAGGRDNYKNFNPSVLAGPVGAQVGSYLAQINSYNQAFTNFDLIMALPSEQRQALKYANKYAAAGNSVLTYSPNQIPEEEKGLWFRPYAMFETVNLNNGPSVGNIAYGSYFGGDSGIIELKRGWDVVYAGYAGYNGSHQTYDGIGIEQNGGQLGGSVFAYKNNFWSGLTLNIGANFGQASNQYGHEDFATLATGIASKTGYNFEFNKGKFIIQPSLLISYSFINMFNYTNSLGVGIKSDPLNAIQIAPGLKFIGNLANGWQPYLGAQMIWNIIDKTHFSAATVSLPNMSVAPYIQYGVGVQKRSGERFTGFAQAMLRNGGINGVALSAGFRWSLGK